MSIEKTPGLVDSDDVGSLSSAGEPRTSHRAGSSVSVLIPTKNRPRELAEAARSILAQTRLPCELLILDQSPDDLGRFLVEQEFAAAPEYARKGVKLQHIIDPSVSGGATARNRLLEIAAGDIVLFIDDDSYLEPEFIEQILSCYADNPHIIGISGLITNYVRPGWTARLWPLIFARGPFHDERQPIYWRADSLRGADPIRVRKFTGASMSFRTEAIGDLRFDSKLTGVSLAEDIDFCTSLAGRVLVIAPKARLSHNKSPINRERDHWLREHAQSAHYLYRRHWNRGLKNRVCFVWLHVGYFSTMPLACLRRRSLEPWRAYRSGVRRAAELTNGPTERKSQRKMFIMRTLDRRVSR